MPGVRGANGAFFLVRVLYNRRTMRLQARRLSSGRESGLGGLSRNHDALHSRGGFGGVLLEIREVTGPDVEVNDRGFLLQVDDWLAGLPLHGMSLRGIQSPGTA